MKGGKKYVLYKYDGGIMKLPSDIADECRRLGIPGEKIKSHYDRWNSPVMRIPSTYEQAAIRALEERKREILSGKKGVRRWLE